MQDIMLDLETMGTNASAAVISVGAVFFDKEETGDGIYFVLDRNDQLYRGRTIDVSTMGWWEKQDIGARAVFDAPKTPVPFALETISDWMKSKGDKFNVWGNGSDFDNAILGDLFQTYEFEVPWSYSRNRCYRTLKNIALPFGSHDLPEFEGVRHNALDDAIYQAAMAGRYLKGTLK